MVPFLVASESGCHPLFIKTVCSYHICRVRFVKEEMLELGRFWGRCEISIIMEFPQIINCKGKRDVTVIRCVNPFKDTQVKVCLFSENVSPIINTAYTHRQ